MWRRAALVKLQGMAGQLEVSFPQGQQRIEDSACPSLNSDLDEVA
jgi:hypothetical protein